MGPETPYLPLNCGFHDRLLHWATLREVVVAKLSWEGEQFEVQAVIEDVFTMASAEYVRFGNGQTFRLDALVEVNGWLAVGNCRIG